jgi:hypothetical protein
MHIATARVCCGVTRTWVCRAIARECLTRYRKVTGRSCYNPIRQGIRYTCPSSDYRIDIELAARRALNPLEMRLFRASWEQAEIYPTISARLTQDSRRQVLDVGLQIRSSVRPCVYL